MNRAYALAVICFCVIIGCDKPLPKVTVLRGRVTFEGKPLSAGHIKFVSVDNVTQTGVELSPDGTFQVLGAPVGPVKMAVSNVQYQMTEPVMSHEGKEVEPAKTNPKYRPIPSKYSDIEASGLTTVIEEGQEFLEIDLKSS
jgi:hypothetical protein